MKPRQRRSTPTRPGFYFILAVVIMAPLAWLSVGDRPDPNFYQGATSSLVTLIGLLIAATTIAADAASLRRMKFIRRVVDPWTFVVFLLALGAFFGSLFLGVRGLSVNHPSVLGARGLAVLIVVTLAATGYLVQRLFRALQPENLCASLVRRVMEASPDSRLQVFKETRGDLVALAEVHRREGQRDAYRVWVGGLKNLAVGATADEWVAICDALYRCFQTTFPDIDCGLAIVEALEACADQLPGYAKERSPSVALRGGLVDTIAQVIENRQPNQLTILGKVAVRAGGNDQEMLAVMQPIADVAMDGDARLGDAASDALLKIADAREKWQVVAEILVRRDDRDSARETGAQTERAWLVEQLNRDGVPALISKSPNAKEFVAASWRVLDKTRLVNLARDQPVIHALAEIWSNPEPGSKAELTLPDEILDTKNPTLLFLFMVELCAASACRRTESPSVKWPVVQIGSEELGFLREFIRDKKGHLARELTERSSAVDFWRSLAAQYDKRDEWIVLVLSLYVDGTCQRLNSRSRQVSTGSEPLDPEPMWDPSIAFDLRDLWPTGSADPQSVDPAVLAELGGSAAQALMCLTPNGSELQPAALVALVIVLVSALARGGLSTVTTGPLSHVLRVTQPSALVLATDDATNDLRIRVARQVVAVAEKIRDSSSVSGGVDHDDVELDGEELKTVNPMADDAGADDAEAFERPAIDLLGLLALLTWTKSATEIVREVPDSSGAVNDPVSPTELLEGLRVLAVDSVGPFAQRLANQKWPARNKTLFDRLWGHAAQSWWDEEFTAKLWSGIGEALDEARDEKRLAPQPTLMTIVRGLEERPAGETTEPCREAEAKALTAVAETSLSWPSPDYRLVVPAIAALATRDKASAIRILQKVEKDAKTRGTKASQFLRRKIDRTPVVNALRAEMRRAA